MRLSDRGEMEPTQSASASTTSRGDEMRPEAGSPPGAEAAPAVQEVRRRHVLYIQGYDPRGPAEYRRLIALELRRFARLWGATASIKPGLVEDARTPSAEWAASVRGGEAQVAVRYETLRWDDLVQKDFAAPLPVKVLRGFVTLWDAVTSGLLWRVARASPRCAIAWSYPVAVILLITAVSAAAGAGACAWVAAQGPWPLALALGAAVAVALLLGALQLVKRAGGFVFHLMDDGRSQRRYARREDAALHARVDRFADRIREVVAAGEADEILVVGHSSGSFLAIDALARVYERDPDFAARSRSTLSLLTVGATELLIGLHPKGGWFRERLGRLAGEPTLFWAEVVGPWDFLNFPHRDPVSELRLLPGEKPRNPTFRRAYLTKMLGQQSIDRMRRRWQVFRLHFQFIMANEVKGPYDYFSLVCGPWTARSQFARTARGSLMAPLLGPPPPPLPRPSYLPPLPGAKR